jgi:hypothetical protein
MNSRAIEVLVIDDDELTAEVIERGLRKAGVQVRIVAAAMGGTGSTCFEAKSTARSAVRI